MNLAKHIPWLLIVAGISIVTAGMLAQDLFSMRAIVLVGILVLSVGCWWIGMRTANHFFDHSILPDFPPSPLRWVCSDAFLHITNDETGKISECENIIITEIIYAHSEEEAVQAFQQMHSKLYMSTQRANSPDVSCQLIPD